MADSSNGVRKNLEDNPAFLQRRASPSKKELELGVCDSARAEQSYQGLSDAQYAVFKQIRAFNRTLRTRQFSESFLELFLQLSVSRGTEAGLMWDPEKSKFSFVWGTAGYLNYKTNPYKVIVLLHSHPRSTNESGLTTVHSYEDLVAAPMFSIAQKNAETTSTVVGRVCGGEMEISAIAAVGPIIYVSNPQEKKFYEWLLKNPEPQHAVLVEEIRELLKAHGIKELRVELNPQKVLEIANKPEHKIPASIELSTLDYLVRNY